MVRRTYTCGTLQDFLMRLRIYVGYVVFSHHLATERRRFDWDWLGGGGFLTRNIGSRDRTLYYTKQRNAG